MWSYPPLAANPWQFWERITDYKNAISNPTGTNMFPAIACFFSSCDKIIEAKILEPVVGTFARFACKVPEGIAGMTNITVSLRNVKGEKSPLDFEGQFDFLYYKPPVVYNIRLMNATTWERSDFARYISAPLCKSCPMGVDDNPPEGRTVAQCLSDALRAPYTIGADCPVWKIFVNGSGFIDGNPEVLLCQYALADGTYPVQTQAVYISPTVMECPIPSQAPVEWKSRTLDLLLKLTVDGQLYTEENFRVDLYPQPTVVSLRQTAGFGVDWRESDVVLQKLFGVRQVHRESQETDRKSVV
jgi:hypothetical protein